MRFFTVITIVAGTTGVLASAGTHAALITYEYTGNPFTDVELPYTTSDSVRGTITIDVVDNSNLPFVNYRQSVDSFSFTDGVQELTHLDAFQYFFAISTDSVGDIVDWSFIVATVGAFISTEKSTAQVKDSVSIIASLAGPSTATVEDDSGVWRQVSAVQVPEPGTLGLLVFSLGLLAGFARPRRI